MEQELTPGTCLRNGSYRIEKILGQGGFGITYLATDLTLDRLVAVKEFFPKDFCGRDDETSHVTLGTQNTAEFVSKLKAKFLKEARNIARLNNPGIIKIHAAFEENDTAYYVMDFIEGESLSSMVKKNGPLPADTALRYMETIGNALEYLHGHRMNHLDVKPANIMVRRSDNMPVLIDFGLSKQYDSEGHQTSTTPTGISHGYAPLEQYKDGGVSDFSPQTDLYSLAATLYYMLTATVPPHAPSLVDEQLTFPPNFPTRLVGPITKAMSSGRRNRHETVSEFMAEITGKRGSRPSGPSPVIPKISIPKISIPKNKWLLIGCAVAVVVVACLAFLLPGGGGKSANATDTVAALDEEVADTVEMSRRADGIYYMSSLGPCSYTGQIDSEGKPHGFGKAVWESGIAKVYDGQWNHGAMDGECTYESSRGYRFEGAFKDNHYHDGKLINPDGTYYVGTFDKKGNKYTGVEYDKSGHQTDTWKMGQ